ncbi:hypothetical protein CROQUDRAFT_93468 [Cronartium quercuum f. sp. fusiforme G11]|uniref:Uncharacterized protein n=1 Tax=Cronartium quercuum f. sp. fusiforme G11 TaxID=708437 RepID=A0A9P6NF71_9BASI|nr:hypothetical protein CROQUDRAFT_93468 [Cronartium quercuum f. sp. fusiforme G11]
MRSLSLSFAKILLIASTSISVSADDPIPTATVTPVIGGDGPRPPTVTNTAPRGSWSAPTGTFTHSGL